MPNIDSVLVEMKEMYGSEFEEQMSAYDNIYNFWRAGQAPND